MYTSRTLQTTSLVVGTLIKLVSSISNVQHPWFYEMVSPSSSRIHARVYPRKQGMLCQWHMAEG